jgi:hypothetical protein
MESQKGKIMQYMISLSELMDVLEIMQMLNVIGSF